MCYLSGTFSRQVAMAMGRPLQLTEIFFNAPLPFRDAFMVGAVAAALRLCRPFLGSAGQQTAALVHLDPGAYYRGQSHRLPGVDRERALSGAMPQPLGPDEAPASLFLSSQEGPGGSGEGAGAGAPPPPPHFIAETFFLTQRLIHTGLMPTGVCLYAWVGAYPGSALLWDECCAGRQCNARLAHKHRSPLQCTACRPSPTSSTRCMKSRRKRTRLWASPAASAPVPSERLKSLAPAPQAPCFLACYRASSLTPVRTWVPAARISGCCTTAWRRRCWTRGWPRMLWRSWSSPPAGSPPCSRSGEGVDAMLLPCPCPAACSACRMILPLRGSRASACCVP